MNILCICDGGTNRSVAMARILNEEFGHEAMSASGRWLGVATRRMLCEWADKIVVMQERMYLYVPKEYMGRLVVCDVGEDRYHTPWHEELRVQCRKFAEENLR